jgi:Glutamine amidotransferases class-II
MTKPLPAPNATGNGIWERPERQGLFDPAFERDACGVGFIADMKGRKSHKIVEDALQSTAAPSAPTRCPAMVQAFSFRFPMRFSARKPQSSASRCRSRAVMPSAMSSCLPMRGSAITASACGNAA